MSDNKQKPESWSHAPMIVGWNNDGSLQTVDSWNVKPTLTDAERECLEWADEIAGNCEEFGRVEVLRGLLKRLGGER